MNHCDRILALLSDRKPHTHLELYRLGTVAHSRISDLRRKGHVINQWRDGDLYLYQLASPLDRGAAPSPAAPPPSGSADGHEGEVKDVSARSDATRERRASPLDYLEPAPEVVARRQGPPVAAASARPDPREPAGSEPYQLELA